MAWNLRGVYMESCSCEAICPCIVLSTPTQGTCSALVAWKIESGRDEGIDLGGLNVALLVHTPGKMHETKWQVAAYIDERASEPQKASLLKIFGGKAGGHPAVLASFVGEMLGAKSVGISFEKKDKNYVVRITDVGDAELEPLVGPAGGDVTVANTPLTISPGQPLIVGRSKRTRLKDYGWDWSFDGRQCMHAPFAYAG